MMSDPDHSSADDEQTGPVKKVSKNRKSKHKDKVKKKSKLDLSGPELEMKLRKKLERKKRKIVVQLKELDSLEPCTPAEEMKFRSKLASKLKEKLLKEEAEDKVHSVDPFGKWGGEPSSSYSETCQTHSIPRPDRPNSSHSIRSAVIPVNNAHPRHNQYYEQHGPGSSTSRKRGEVFYPSNKPQSDHSKSRAGSCRGTYTGYEYRGSRSRSPVTPSTHRQQSPIRDQPPPPRHMPEHIRWLHERWRKYDGSFFDEKKQPEAVKTLKVPTADERNKYRRDMDEYRKERKRSPPRKFEEERTRKYEGEKTRDEIPRWNGMETMDPRASRTRTRRDDLKLVFSQPYYQFRKGGEYQWNPGRMLSFKEFLLSQRREVKEQDEAVSMYNNYKLEFRRKAFEEFFQAHCEEEWFLEKYHPLLKVKKDARRRDQVHKRLTVFMQLLVRGWFEISMDNKDSRGIRKLLDATIVLLEGGDEGDVACLSDLDYVLEEKKEESYTINAVPEEDSDSEEEKEGKAPGGGRWREEQEADDAEGEKPSDEKLEQMQHAKDYTYYNQEKLKQPADIEDAPDILEDKTIVRTHEYAGSGVFVSHVQNPKVLEEMNLHKYVTLLIKNIPPTVPRQELEDLLSESHGGFLRMHLTEPEPSSNYFRQAIASFWNNANTQKILWKIRGYKMRGSALIVIEYRDFQRRVFKVDGIAGDKSVVLRDIQLCKSLIEYLDRRYYLWDQKPEDNLPPENQTETQENTVI